MKSLIPAAMVRQHITRHHASSQCPGLVRCMNSMRCFSVDSPSVGTPCASQAAVAHSTACKAGTVDHATAFQASTGRWHNAFSEQPWNMLLQRRTSASPWVAMALSCT